MIFPTTHRTKHQAPQFVVDGLEKIAAAVEAITGHDPADNVGADANFANDVFSIRAYDWGADLEEGEDAVNFACSDFSVSWYKYLNDSANTNRLIDQEQWEDLVARCLSSLTAH